MPYYRWKGVNIHAAYCSGKIFARNTKELELLLMKKDIALVKIKKSKFTLPRPIFKKDIVDFFKQLAVLLESEILLPQALTIIKDQGVNIYMQQKIEQVIEDVNRGMELSSSLQRQNLGYNSIAIHMISIGEKAGCLPSALNALIEYLDMTHVFSKKVKNALMMPAITFIAFIGIALGVMIGIVPRFVLMFESMGKTLPPLTQYIINISNVLRQPALSACLASMVLVGAIFAWALRYRLKPYKDWLVLYIPIIGSVVLYSNLFHWLHALSMLIKNKVPLVPALQIAHPLVSNIKIYKSLQSVTDNVSSGLDLPYALLQVPNQPFLPEVLAILQVGHESGKFDIILEKAARLYYQKVEDKLRFCIFIIQPLLLVVLGLLVGFLVFALYMPIFNIADV